MLGVDHRAVASRGQLHRADRHLFPDIWFRLGLWNLVDPRLREPVVQGRELRSLLRHVLHARELRQSDWHPDRGTAGHGV